MPPTAQAPGIKVAALPSHPRLPVMPALRFLALLAGLLATAGVGECPTVSPVCAGGLAAGGEATWGGP